MNWSIVIPLILKYGPEIVALIQKDAPEVEALFAEIAALFKKPSVAPVTTAQVEPLFMKALKK